MPLSSLRPHDPNAPIPKPQPSKRPNHDQLSEREKEKKKLKGEKWMEKQKARADEMRGRQNSWQKFGKKAAKKGIHIAGLEGKSVFQTPDNPYGELPPLRPLREKLTIQAESVSPDQDAASPDTSAWASTSSRPARTTSNRIRDLRVSRRSRLPSTSSEHTPSRDPCKRVLPH